MKNPNQTDIDTEHDRISGSLDLDAGVIAKIAAMAIKDVKGLHTVHKLHLPFADDVTDGVGVEVGQKEAAVDLEAVIAYGHDIRLVAREVRQSIANAVRTMAGREVVEVNIHVVGIDLPEDAEPEPTSSRVK
jgi:uncharacterized alkaline shock family protein YloU